jgi:osmotically-inducible protein OsmY
MYRPAPQSLGARRSFVHQFRSRRCRWAGLECAVPHLKRDPEIHQDVRTELGVQADDGRRSVEITVHLGVVYLTGFVESYAEKRAIDRAVRRIGGVKDLRNYLHVRPS